MVATLLRLKLRLLLNSLTRETWRLVFAIIGVVYALGVIALVAVAAFFLGREGLDLGAPAVLVGAALTLLWTFLPLLAFGVDDTLDPARFALFTTPTRMLGAGLILAGAISIPGLLTIGTLVALTPAWLMTPGAALAWVLASVLGFLTCLTLARLITTAAATQLRSRRGKDAAAGIGILVVLGAVIAPNLLQRADLADLWRQLRPVIEVATWTPLGASWAIPGAVAAGNYSTAVIHLVVACIWLALALLAWVRILAPAMLISEETSRKQRTGRNTFDLPLQLHRVLRLPLPAATVAARSLRYWRTDSRYFTQAITIVLLPPLLTIVFAIVPESPAQILLFIPPFMAFFAGWVLHNDTAFDSTALWMGISAGVSGRDDRIGRGLAYILWSLPALLIVTAAILTYARKWEYGTIVYGVSLGVYGAGLCFSLIISGFVVYPVQPPGTSPFSTSGTGSMGLTMLTQTIAMIATFVGSLPVILAGVFALVFSPMWAVVALIIGIATAVAGIWLGSLVGGRLLDGRAPAHLLAMRGWSGH